MSTDMNIVGTEKSAVPAFINVADIEYVLQNAPVDATFESAKNALEKTDNNLIESIALLWNIEKPVEKPKTKYDEFRDICDSFDTEMEKYMKENSAKNSGKVEVNSIPQENKC